MLTPTRLGTTLCALCLVLNTALAQTQPPTSNQAPAPSVTATATSDRVHFATSGAVTHLHLVIFTTGQEPVYDSGGGGWRHARLALLRSARAASG